MRGHYIRMPKRAAAVPSDGPTMPAKRRQSDNTLIGPGNILTDIYGKKWRLGKPVGVGAFGQVFLASDSVASEVNDQSQYVAKIESHSNGPLFVEINCYLRIGKEYMIQNWKESKKLQSLGMPHYIASGSHIHADSKYRFLIIPRYDTDLEHVLQKNKENLHGKPVLTTSLQLLDVLEYIHNKGFIHADIKASNILLKFATMKQDAREDKDTCIRSLSVMNRFRACRLATAKVVRRRLRSNVRLCRNETVLPTEDQLYLLDYGLASKYKQSNGRHKSCADQRRAHAGTLLFCSLDAHRGVMSRKSDLESLGYNIIYWLTGWLPWCDDLDDPEIVMLKKKRCMMDLESFLFFCFGRYPKFLLEYLKYIQGLDSVATPDYNKCALIFKKGMEEFGVNYDGKFNFELKPTMNIVSYSKKLTDSENIKCEKIANVINRAPLKSNSPIRLVLRKKDNKKLQMMKWSQILMDPELMMRQKRSKEENTAEPMEESILYKIDINELNPTETMLEVYNNYIERFKYSDGTSPKYRMETNLNNLEGYTSAMMAVHNKMLERKALEELEVPTKTYRGRRKKTANIPIVERIVTVKRNLRSNGILKS